MRSALLNELENMTLVEIDKVEHERNCMEVYFTFDDGEKIKIKILDSRIKIWLKENETLFKENNYKFNMLYRLTPRSRILKKIEIAK